MSVPRDSFRNSLRRLYDYIDSISVNNRSVIPVNTLHEVSSNEQMISYALLTVDGELRVAGELRVVSWPS